MRRVVVTGIGIVSCIGNNKTEVLDSLLKTKSGIVFSEEHKKYNFRSQVVGSIKNLNFSEHIDRKQLRFMGDGSAYNFIALKEAIKESGLEDKDISNEHKAYIHFNLWEYAKIDTSRSIALKLYENLYEKFPKHIYKICIDRLS